MRLSTRHQLVIAALGAVVFFVNLGATRLWDQDEAYFARTAVEMQQRHDWVVPYFNHEMFAHKPPLMYWMMRVGFLLFGVNEFAARFWSAAFAVATALLVYRLGRKMFNAQVGLWAGLAMCTTLDFDVVARAATPDSLLVFCTTLALYLFVRREHWDAEQSSFSRDAKSAQRSERWQTWVGIYACMAAAVLVKGPIGILLPGSTIGLYLLVRDALPKPAKGSGWENVPEFMRRFSPLRILGTMWNMRPLLALGMLLAIAGPWFALVGLRTGGNFLWEFFGVQNIGRFLHPMDGHRGPFWYYLPAILAGFFPWSIFGGLVAVDLVRRCRGAQPWQRGAKFLACWIAVFVGFFSLAGTKLPSYVLPAFPALALATGCFIERWAANSAAVKSKWMRVSFASLVAVGAVTLIAAKTLPTLTFHGRSVLEMLDVTSQVSGDFTIISVLGVMLIAGGVGCWWCFETGRPRAAIYSLAVTGAAVWLTGFAVAAPQIDRHKATPMLAEAIRQRSVGTAHVAGFGYFQPSLVYYTDGRVDSCNSAERVLQFFEPKDDQFLITTEEQYTHLAAQLPADVVVLDRQPDFPRRGTVVLLGRKNDVAQRENKASR